MEFDNVVISDKMDYNGDILLIALVIWVLSHIFISGLRLKEEQELTV